MDDDRYLDVEELYNEQTKYDPFTGRSVDYCTQTDEMLEEEE